MKKLIVLFFVIEIAYAQEGVWTSTISEVIEFEVKNKIDDYLIFVQGLNLSLLYLLYKTYSLE